MNWCNLHTSRLTLSERSFILEMENWKKAQGTIDVDILYFFKKAIKRVKLKIKLKNHFPINDRNWFFGFKQIIQKTSIILKM